MHGERDTILLPEIEQFLRVSKMTPTRFGRNARRDPAFVLDLRRGRTPTARVQRRVRHYIATAQQEAA